MGKEHKPGAESAAILRQKTEAQTAKITNHPTTGQQKNENASSASVQVGVKTLY